MILLEIFVGLALDRVWGKIAVWRSFGWFRRFAGWVETRLGGGAGWKGAAGVLLTILPVAFGVAAVHYMLGEMLGVLAFVFSVAVLLLCLGPGDLDSETREFIHAYRAGDKEAARRYAVALIGTAGAPVDSKQLVYAVIEAILVQACERIFGVLFWFIVLGPMGAVLYRLSSLLKNLAASQQPQETSGYADASSALCGILGWLPARLTALSYAMAGSFADAMYKWREEGRGKRADWMNGCEGVLVASGLGALRMDGDDLRVRTDEHLADTLQVKAAMALVWRTVALWLVVIAFITVTGWVI
ncbi:MAG: regulatory signaling modulator protein AmpE [Gammaproteobacteria bacterium]